MEPSMNFWDSDSKVIGLKPQEMEDGRVECLALDLVKVFLFGVSIFAHIIQLFSLRQLQWLVIWHITCCLNKNISKKDQTLRHLLWAMDLLFVLREQLSGKKHQPSGASRLHHILCPKFAGMDETWHPKCSQRVGTHVGKGSPGSIRPEDMTPLKFSSLQLSLVALEVAHFTHLPSIKQSGNENTREFQDPQVPHQRKIMGTAPSFFEDDHGIINSLKSSHLRVIGYQTSLIKTHQSHTSPTDLRSDLNGHFLWTKNRLKLWIWWSTLDATYWILREKKTPWISLNIHEVDAIFSKMTALWLLACSKKCENDVPCFVALMSS